MDAEMGVTNDTAAATVVKLQKMSKQVSKSLKKDKKWKMTDEFMENFKEIAIVLSRLLPDITDKSITEIDDILYPNLDREVTKSDSVEYDESLVEKCFRPFNNIYKEVFLRHSNHILDTVFLQLIDHSSSEFFEQNYSKCNVLRFLFWLVRQRSETNMCRSLKMLKLGVIKHRSVIESYIKKDFMECNTILWLSQFLTNIPEGKHPQKKRVTSWLSQQSKATFDNLAIETTDKDMMHIMNTLNLLKEKDFDENYIMTIAKKICTNTNLFLVDQLYQYFSSAKTEEQKVKRIGDFLKGYCTAFYEPDEQKNPIEYGGFLQNFDCVHFALECFMFEITENTEYSEEFLKLLDKHHRNDLEPHISESSGYLTDVSAKNELQLSQNKETSSESENENDFTIEKFLFYDDFIKILYLMSTIYDICMRCPEFIKVEGDCEGFEADTFRSFYYSGHMGYKLRNPKKCGSSPWWLSTVLRKCPFLFINKHHEYMIEDLIKALNGEEIEDSIREKLTFLVRDKLQNFQQ